jgi:hypothetical protein
MEILVTVAKHLSRVKICGVISCGPIVIEIGEIFLVFFGVLSKIGLEILVIAPSIEFGHRLGLRDTHTAEMLSTFRLCRDYTAKIIFMVLGNTPADLQTFTAASKIHYEIFQYPFLNTVLAIVLEL